MTTPMRPESQILILAARRSLSEADKLALRQLVQGPIDWKYLMAAARTHALMPLLCRHLTAVVPDAVPDPVLRQLESDFASNRHCNLILFAETARLSKLFSEAEISSISFKGQLLGADVYGDIGLRQAGDIDILIDKRSFTRAKKILTSDGYRMTWPLTRTQEASHLRFHCELPFEHHDGVRKVDLHWALSPRTFPFKLTTQSVLERSQIKMVGGKIIRTFSDEDLLLYLCMHSAKHSWARLEWACSIAELIGGKSQLDWKLTVDLAKEAGVEKIMLLGLRLAQQLRNLKLPEEELSQLRQLSDDDVQKVWLKFFSDEARTAASQIEIFRFNRCVMDRRLEVLKSLVRSALVPTVADWQAVTLPNFLYPLYYLLRPLRLLKSYCLPAVGSASPTVAGTPYGRAFGQ